MMRPAVLICMLSLAGCAGLDEPQQLAARDCKVYPLEPTQATYPSVRRPTSELDQRWAVASLAGSEARFRALNGPFGHTGLIEDSLRDCNR